MRRNPKEAKVSWLGGKRSWKRDPVIKGTPSKKFGKPKVVWVDSQETKATYVDGLRAATSQVWAVVKPGAKICYQIIYRLRGLFLAIPVLLAAMRLAAENMAKLPSTVYFDSASLDAEKNLIFESFSISRELAVYGPLGLTIFCLLMMLISRRVVYPWVISIFTLILPVVLLFLNTFL